MEDLIKGKQPLLKSDALPRPVLVKPPEKLWNKPPDGWVTLTIDGSFKEVDRTAGLGMVLRDTEGSPIFCSCRFLQDCDSPLEAEARACVEGLALALDRSPLPIRVETDCIQLVAMATSRAPD